MLYCCCYSLLAAFCPRIKSRKKVPIQNDKLKISPRLLCFFLILFFYALKFPKTDHCVCICLCLLFKHKRQLNYSSITLCHLFLFIFLLFINDYLHCLHCTSVPGHFFCFHIKFSIQINYFIIEILFLLFDPKIEVYCCCYTEGHVICFCLGSD